MLNTKTLLTAGKATFTLEGPLKTGGEVRYTYRIDRVEGGKYGTTYYVKVLTGPDNESDYTYLGVYDPAGGVRLTKASRFAADTRPVAVFRRFAAVVGANEEAKFASAGWTVHWSNRCQRCGRPLTVPASVDSRIGPDCAEAMGFPYSKKPKKAVVVEASEHPNLKYDKLAPVRDGEGEIVKWVGEVAGYEVTVLND